MLRSVCMLVFSFTRRLFRFLPQIPPCPPPPLRGGISCPLQYAIIVSEKSHYEFLRLNPKKKVTTMKRLHLIAVVAAAACAVSTLLAVGAHKEVRNLPFRRRRRQYVDDARLLELENEYRLVYRMGRATFERLVALLEHRLHQDEVRSRQRSGTDPLTPATKVSCAIRWLAGGRHHDIRRIYRLSKTHFYEVVYQVIDAINSEAALGLHFPATAAERRATAAGFAATSPHGVINGCIGCVDGWLCPIIAPPADSVGRVSNFFSGHYHRFGVNVQACCDYNARFTAFTCQSGGGCNDAVAFRQWELPGLVKANRDYTYLIGDNAYPNRRWLLTPYNKLEISGRPDRFTYNWYVSNVRQVIERAFGILVRKWCIVGQPLRHDVQNIPRIVEACIRLHNYCIEARVAAGGFSVVGYANEVAAEAQGAQVDTFLPPTVFDYEDDDPRYREVVRKAMVEKITALNLRVPPPSS
eukprot:GHVU01084932.1.p1 GENE.GHVU01084932.1~~GHVU01084932.1.p1  ORF type:complete len:468 (+),score=27.97 GHVU01084932.1:108-1511(+)